MSGWLSHKTLMSSKYSSFMNKSKKWNGCKGLKIPASNIAQPWCLLQAQQTNPSKRKRAHNPVNPTNEPTPVPPYRYLRSSRFLRNAKITPLPQPKTAKKGGQWAPNARRTSVVTVATSQDSRPATGAAPLRISSMSSKWSISERKTC